MTDVPRFDVFVAYAGPDRAWVRVLAGRLRDAGFGVFFDEWVILPGDVVTRRQEDGIQAAAAGVVVCSPRAVSSPRVMDQYAALYEQALTAGRRLIPVLYEDVGLPPFLDIRRCVDFRHADGAVYETRVAELVAAIGEQQPEAAAVPALPPGHRIRPEGTRRALLKVGRSAVEILDQDRGERVSGIPAGEAVGRVPARLNELHRIGRHRDGLVVRGLDGSRADRLSPVLRESGVVLGEAFTADPVGAALSGLIEDARGQGAGLRLAVCAEDDVADWPWEALVLPGADRALALTDAVQVFRAVDVDRTVPGVTIAGPLRILVVLASPEGTDGGPLLDVEHELATVLDAVEPTRKHTAAQVRVLNLGTLAAIREALTAERFHVLHISCHAAPGRLVLEDDQGRPHEVSAGELIAAIPENRRPAAVVLAGCSTALSDQAAPGDSAVALPGLARELLAAGVPQVVAMTAAVTDRYAALFAGRLYRELAMAAEPMVVDAVAHARRQVESDRRALPDGDPGRRLVEWATPVVFVRGRPLPLYDPAAPPGEVTQVPEPVLPAGVPLRPVGDFVGRRADLRVLLAAVRRQRAGVVIHGIGGVGKSSLAAELLRLLGDDAGLVVPVVGAAGADQILAAFAQALFTRAIADGLPDTHAWRQLAGYLRVPGEPWQQRLATAFGVLAQQPVTVPVTLLIDNFETNLEERADGPAVVRDNALAELLAAWVGSPGAHRLLVTSRYPFALPGGAGRRLVRHHLGPLSLAETRKLIWRLPGLDALTGAQQQRAWTDVGGHPRTLEYLDALLRQGRARFDDVTDRLERLLSEQGIPDPQQWITDLHTGYDGDDPGQARDGLVGRALAEAVTLTVNDTLLDRLLGLLDTDTRALLVGAAVYRQPVDELALAWQSSAPDPIPADPDRDRRLAELSQKLTAGQPTDDLISLGYTSEQAAQLHADVAELSRPPLAEVTVAAARLPALGALGLLTPVPDPDDGLARYGVHRWTATALGRLHPEATTSSHRRAAAYYSWRVQYQRQDKLADLRDRVEARYHHHVAGDLKAAVSLTYDIRDQLHTWAAWDWEISICQETLTWLPADSYDTAAFTHQLGILAQARGDYAEAERRYQQSLTTSEELGNRVGMATGYHQLGMIAQARGDYAEAERRYQQSLTIKEELGNRAGAAASYHELGNLAYLTGDYAEAERRYQQSLTISEELGNRAGAATTISQLGSLRAETGNPTEAVTLHCRALAIRLEIGIPQATNNIARLRELRSSLDASAFSDAASTVLDEQSVRDLTALLDQAEKSEQEDQQT
ncbi:hypothetical protein DMB66_48115 [Actinoplanes sp. ATCC 53533]|uniref:tetratricopeptide repeat protein n=1 Tax=Actinoplanes sp. ATCC 53533 TaxID=1288362 RepID=UPI000F77018D|nr:tetratricopeptide repeat protein [Actinoplanes sp. ATCC 53533]RSM47518.1 hypothetical protein DMB66_48115 [Actinoplanes sp. ATCC 53533]